VTIVDTSTDPVRITTAAVGPSPYGIAVNPVTGNAYVANDARSVTVLGVELRSRAARTSP